MSTRNYSATPCPTPGCNWISRCPLQNAFIHRIAFDLHESSVVCVPILILQIGKHGVQGGKWSLTCHRASTCPPTVPMASLLETEDPCK